MRLFYPWAALALIMAIPSQSFAADKSGAKGLGGGCCADLEERVAELEATTARSGNRKVSVEISGQISSVILYDPEAKRTRFGIGNYSANPDARNGDQSSYFQLRGSSKIRDKWSVGFKMQVGVAGKEQEDLEVRESFLYLETPSGTFSLGRAPSATHNLARRGVVETYPVAEPMDWSSNSFYPSDNGVRENLVRYDSVAMGGLVFSGSYGDSDAWDVAARWFGSGGSWRSVVGAGYRDTRDGRTVVSGTAGALHGVSGLWVQVSAYQSMIEKAPDETVWHLQGGVHKKLFGDGFGPTTLYGEASQIHLSDGRDDFMYGFGVIQRIGAMDLFGGYRLIDETDSQVKVGARIKF